MFMILALMFFAVPFFQQQTTATGSVEAVDVKADNNTTAALLALIVELEKGFAELEKGLIEAKKEFAELKTLSADDKNKKTVVEQMWSNNHWDRHNIHPAITVSANELTAIMEMESVGWVTIRAVVPVSLALLSAVGQQKFVYHELVVTKNPHPGSFAIGWILPEYPLAGYIPFEKRSGSYALYSKDGTRWPSSDDRIVNIGQPFQRENDVVGTGIVLAANGRLKVFFTLNGRLNGGIIDVEENHQHAQLFPAVSFYYYHTALEANFGGDPDKPLLFNVNANNELKQLLMG